MTAEEIIGTYGYWGLLVGTFLEGETILLLAGFAAHQRYLNLTWVLVIAFIGSLSGDQMWFLVGRWKGQSLISKWPRLHEKADRVDHLLSRFHTALILSFRFFYGFRTVVPLVLGAGRRISRVRFFLLNAAGAAIWSVLVALAGFFFGRVLHMLLGKLQKHERTIVIAIIAAAALGALLHHFIGRWRRRRIRDRQSGC